MHRAVESQDGPRGQKFLFILPISKLLWSFIENILLFPVKFSDDPFPGLVIYTLNAKMPD